MKNLSELESRLRILEPREELPVLIFWKPTEAIVLPWQFFTGYLDDFCYPGEDVEVWSLTETWEFLYHHDDRAIFGKLYHPLPRERRVVTPIPPKHLDEIIRLVQANDIVAATKLYRKETGVGLKDAYDEIKRMKKLAYNIENESTVSQEPAWKERLRFLKAKNRLRLARERSITFYEQELHYAITMEQFIDLEQSNKLLHLAYDKAKTQCRKVLDYQEISTAVDLFKRETPLDPDTLVIFYYYGPLQTSGVRIPLKACWELIERIGGDHGDIIFVEEQGTFGLCIEPDEHNYWFTHWRLL